jgi:protease II
MEETRTMTPLKVAVKAHELTVHAHTRVDNYYRLGIYKVSPDHRLLADSLDAGGAEDYVVTFKDLASGEKLPGEIPNTNYSADWGNDSETITNLLACARYLIAEGYTSRDRLAMMGRSAGGLLSGTILNMGIEG